MKETEEHLLRIYITDALKTITENTAIYEGSNCMTNRYIDILNENAKKKKKELSGDEIADSVLNKIGV